MVKEEIAVETAKYGLTDKELMNIVSQSQAKIVAVGVGGAGGNVVDIIHENKVKNVQTIAVNTDAQDLLKINSNLKILIGKGITGGLGAGSDPVIGEAAAKESIDEIKGALGGADLVFLITGLGGGTGTGAAPIIAQTARDTGAAVLSIAFFPFSSEGAKKQEIALEGAKNLYSNSDSFILIQNDRILGFKPEISTKEGIKLANRLTLDLINKLVQIIFKSNFINVDFADLRTIIEDGGPIAFFSNRFDENDKLEDSVNKLLDNSLLEVDVSGGKKALIYLETPADFEIEKINGVVEAIVANLDPKAQVIWGLDIVNSEVKVLEIFSLIAGVKILNLELEKPVPTPAAKIDLGIDLESL